jgi:hypothetical protein
VPNLGVLLQDSADAGEVSMNVAERANHGNW